MANALFDYIKFRSLDKKRENLIPILQNQIHKILAAISQAERFSDRAQVIALQRQLITKVKERASLLAQLEATCHDRRHFFNCKPTS